MNRLWDKATVQVAVAAALKNWRNLDHAPQDTLEGLLLTQEERRKVQGNGPTARRLATNRVLLNSIDLLQQQNPLGAQILSRRFMDDQTILEVAYQLKLSEDQIKRRQRDALDDLIEIIWGQEVALRHNQGQIQQANLPPAGYTHLFGLEAIHQELVSLLLTPTSPWIVALVGIGGIGKTSLADWATRTVIDQFMYTQIIWLRIEPTSTTDFPNPAAGILYQLAQQIIPTQASSGAYLVALRQLLQSAPYLVVIDNLETEAETEQLIEQLQDLANPSKFLLTTRVRFPLTSGVRSLLPGELALPDALALLRYQAGIIGLTELAQATDTDLANIYRRVGGNPLALKLVVGLAAVLPLPQILIDLTQAETREIEQMYRHIYWRVWQSLSEDGQMVLEMMPLAAAIGITPEQMAVMTALPLNRLWPAITELVNRSLLEVRGTTWERRYGIHRLTESFLQTEIIHWPDGEEVSSERGTVA